MAKIFDKIVQSKYPPKDNNVLWDDGENLKISRNGSFENVVSTIENNKTNLAVEVTVDNTTGNPSVNTTVEESTIKLAFSGLKGETGPQGNSGYQGAAGELEVVNDLVSDKPTAALSAAQGKILDAKVAQLDQDWNALKEQIQGAVLKVEVAPHIEVVTIEGGAAILQPDKLYDFGEVANLAIGFEAPIEGKAANYAFQFKSPADAPTTITMPDSVVFPVESDSMFNVKAGRTYQVTILNGLAVATSWEV